MRNFYQQQRVVEAKQCTEDREEESPDAYLQTLERKPAVKSEYRVNLDKKIGKGRIKMTKSGR